LLAGGRWEESWSATSFTKIRGVVLHPLAQDLRRTEKRWPNQKKSASHCGASNAKKKTSSMKKTYSHRRATANVQTNSVQ